MTVTLKHKRGDTFSFQCTVYDRGGAVINLTGYTVTAKLKTADSATTVHTFSPSITSAANGEISISASAASTDAWDIPAGSTSIVYHIDLRFEDSVGGFSTTETFFVELVREITDY